MSHHGDPPLPDMRVAGYRKRTACWERDMFDRFVMAYRGIEAMGIDPARLAKEWKLPGEREDK